MPEEIKSESLQTAPKSLDGKEAVLKSLEEVKVGLGAILSVNEERRNSGFNNFIDPQGLDLLIQANEEVALVLENKEMESEKLSAVLQTLSQGIEAYGRADRTGQMKDSLSSIESVQKSFIDFGGLIFALKSELAAGEAKGDYVSAIEQLERINDLVGKRVAFFGDLQRMMGDIINTRY